MLLQDYRPQSRLVVKKTDVPMPKFPVFDVHTHFGKLIMGDCFDELFDAKAVVASMKAHGITHAVNLDLSFGQTRQRVLKKLEGTGDFFVHFGSVDVARFEEPGFERMVYQSIVDGVRIGMRGLKLWKPIGLGYQDKNGRYLRPDDERLHCIFQTAAEFKLPVLFHIADPVAFFYPVDVHNERYEELCGHPDWSFADPKFYRFEELMKMQEHMIAENPDTTFIIAHGGSYSENLGQVAQWLDRYPNMNIDIAARISEFGRQPYSAKVFFEKYYDRILFGTDFTPVDEVFHPVYYRFLETDDEYFSPTDRDGDPGQGRWNIYGIQLSDRALEHIYHKNAERILAYDER